MESMLAYHSMAVKQLAREFFHKPALSVARRILGKFLVRRRRGPSSRKATKGKQIALMITEVEAYDGPDDKASHASRGLTPRTKIMFGEAGYFYVYFTYGMHWLVNIVTGPKGYPAAILLRAGRTTDGKDINGPARLAKYLKIDKRFNGKPASRRIGLWFEDRPHTRTEILKKLAASRRSPFGVGVKQFKIVAGKRVGVDYAGPIWSKKPYNFKLIT
jgi:DNA-3-methyladenine glycosylase